MPDLLFPSLKALHCLVCREKRAPAPVLLTRVKGGGAGVGPGRGFLHRAVLSVSLSISNRMRPGRSLLAESESMSGKVLRSGSETLELVSGQKQETCCLEGLL